MHAGEFLRTIELASALAVDRSVAEVDGTMRQRDMLAAFYRVFLDVRDLAGALALAGSITTNVPSVVRAIKRTLRAAVNGSFEATIELETAIQAITQDSPEAAEGWAAFRQRRVPNVSD